MAYIVPLEQPLSETKAKLIAQIGSMKNLTNLPFFKKFKLKKGDEISMFDYLLKILRAMGIDPQILLTAFLNELFSTEKLVELILRATAQLCTSMKKNLDSTSTFVMPVGDLDKDQKKELTAINYNFLNSGTIKGPLTIGVEALKSRILQELMILLFGRPKKTEAAYGENGLAVDENRLNELIDESICGGGQIFSVSNPAYIDYGDLEYNRLQKLEQVKNGNLTFKVTCQGVDISLPDDPTYLFRTAPSGFQNSEPLSPQESMANVFNFVSSKIQKGVPGASSQSDAVSGGKSFTQKLLETLISSITCLLSSFFVGFIGSIPGAAQGVGPQAEIFLREGLLNMLPNKIFNNTTDPVTGKRVGDFVPATSCEITKGNSSSGAYTKGNLTSAQAKKVSLMTILCNLILNMLIGFILSYVLEKVKSMIKKYIAKRAQEKAERKLGKIKNQYVSSVPGVQGEKTKKAQRQIKLLKKIIPALKPSENTYTIPNNYA